MDILGGVGFQSVEPLQGPNFNEYFHGFYRWDSPSKFLISPVRAMFLNQPGILPHNENFAAAVNPRLSRGSITLTRW